ncbi:MAG: hypothetical protein PHI63_00055 [Patescibacteria group bacterium]|nr:hypothetical protein [Patescibacteria group bacterium]
MTRSVVLSSLKYFSLDLVGKVLYWPLWWYTVGFQKLMTITAGNVLEEEHQLGVVLWWKNLFVPMYGQYDWQGRIISFFMRLVIGIARIALLVVWFAFSLTVIVAWVLVLPLAAYFLWINVLYAFDIAWWPYA